MMLNHKTQAVERLESFFEVNYEKMFGIAVKEVGEHKAWDAVNDTYISLRDKETRGRGHYDQNYGSRYDSYIYGALYGTLKGMRKGSEEICETDMQGVTSDGDKTPSYLETVGSSDFTEELINSTVSAMDICSEFLDACCYSDTDVAALVRAIREPEGLSPSFLSKFFSSLRKAARSDNSVITAIEDFVYLYGDKPREADSCLAQLGVSV